VRWLVANLIGFYRHNRRILRALHRYARTHPDPEFRAEAAAINAESLRLTGVLLEPYRDQMSHPDPERAIRYGLLFATMALRETILGDEAQRPGYELADDDLEDELTRLVLGYLGLPLPEPGDLEQGAAKLEQGS